MLSRETEEEEAQVDLSNAAGIVFTCAEEERRGRIEKNNGEKERRGRKERKRGEGERRGGEERE